LTAACPASADMATDWHIVGRIRENQLGLPAAEQQFTDELRAYLAESKDSSQS
jgi:hypothetical protein